MKNRKIMRSIKAGILLFIIIFSASDAASAFKEEAGGGVLYGQNFAFRLQAPAQWIFDSDSAAGIGILAVMYPKEYNWSNSPIIIYGRAIPNPNKMSLDEFIKQDFITFKNHSPDVVMSDYNTILTKDGRKAHIKSFGNDKWGNTELVAYVAVPNAFVVVAMTSKNRELFDKSVPRLMEVIKSIEFVTDNIIRKNS